MKKDINTEGYKSWFVAVSCSIVNCLLMCPYRLSGLIFVAILEQYNTSREKASLPLFMCVLMFGLNGPLAGWIGQNIGVEMTTLIGCLIAAFGFGISFFAQDITFTIITLGFVYGLGMCLGITLIPNILKKHFTKNYNTAHGINMAGPCVGALIFPFIAVYVLNIYALSGTCLLIGGLMLNGVPLSMILNIASRNKTVHSQRTKEANSADERLLKSCTEDGKKFENKKPSESTNILGTSYEELVDKSHQEISSLKKECIDGDKLSETTAYIEKKEFDIITSEKDIEKHTMAQINLEKTKFLNDTNISDISIREIDISKGDLAQNCKESTFKELPETNTYIENNLEHQKSLNGYKTSNTTYAKLEKINRDLSYKSLVDYEANFMEINKDKSITGVNEQQSASISQKDCRNKNRTTLQLYRKLFRNPSFLVYMTAVSLHYYIATVVWTTIIDYSRDKNVGEYYEVHLLMFPSLADLIGRLFLVWIIDKKYMSSSAFSITTNIMLAVAIGLIILSTSISMLMSGALMFGLGSGAMFTTYPGQVFEFMEKDFYIIAMASKTLLYVPLSFTASPLIEYFRTERQSYDGLYYVVIAICILSCLITPLMSRFSKVKNGKLKQSQETKQKISTELTT